MKNPTKEISSSPLIFPNTIIPSLSPHEVFLYNSSFSPAQISTASVPLWDACIAPQWHVKATAAPRVEILVGGTGKVFTIL